MFPLGLWPSAVIFEFVGLATGNPTWPMMSYYMIGLRILGAIAAAIPGLVDWLAIPRGSRAKRIGLWHMGGNVLVLLLFVVSWFLRRNQVAAPPALATWLAIVGVLLAIITGWLGGELVERLGVGVHDGANVDAPSSLSEQPASLIGEKAASIVTTSATSRRSVMTSLPEMRAKDGAVLRSGAIEGRMQWPSCDTCPRMRPSTIWWTCSGTTAASSSTASSTRARSRRSTPRSIPSSLPPIRPCAT
jgi:uncharacterized membrane protein